MPRSQRPSTGSRSDTQLTRRLTDALALIDVRCLNHIVD
ncbi:MAG: hypothetical protein JRJ51_16325 [Deltaproteobacteria bacterium]|nr:hypothetical protein [Deltaproteobacteria bacterium]